jgi:hypothetical protein
VTPSVPDAAQIREWLESDVVDGFGCRRAQSSGFSGAVSFSAAFQHI